MLTFGIITCADTSKHLEQVIQSIRQQQIPEYEIIVIGGHRIDNVRWVYFDESKKPNWITKKKNLITQHARFPTIVYLHDYISFSENWYKSQVDFGENWDICLNRVENLDGTRWRDLCYWDYPGLGNKWTCYEPWCSNGMEFNGTPHLIEAQQFDKRYIYINGSYWIAKKRIMEQCPLNEELGWGNGEDVDFSIRVRNKADIKYNNKAVVRLLKHKDLGIPIYKENQ